MDPVIVLTMRAGFVLLWSAAAAHKFRDLAAFRGSLRAYAVLPDLAVAATAMALPGAELLAAGLLAIPATVPQGAVVTAGLLVVYAVAMGVNLVRGRHDVDCGCFGPARRRTISTWLVVRNVVLALGALGLATVPHATRPLVWVDAMTITAATATLMALWLAVDVLASSTLTRRTA